MKHKMRNNSQHSAQDLIKIGFVGLFCVMICLPVITMLLEKRTYVSNSEERTMAELPAFHSGGWDLGTLIKKCQLYFDDNFGLRGWLIKTQSKLKYHLFGASSVDKVLVGNDGWLFYADVSDGDPLGCYRGTKLFSLKELAKVSHNLESLRSWLEKRHKKLYVFIAPEKVTIYSEYLPEHLRRISNKNRFDQVVEYLKENTNVTVIDPRPSLLSQKSKYVLYYKLDSHWNEIGSFLAYRALIDCIRRDFPGIRPLELEDFNVKWDEGGDRDLARMLMLRDVLHQEAPHLIPKSETKFREIPLHQSSLKGKNLVETENPDESLPSAVIYRDSFFSGMLRYVPQNFRRTYDIWDADPDFNLISKEDPDLVILELTERALSIWNFISTPENTK